MSITPRTLPQRGFTLIELLVVIAIISILAAILFPVFGRARENARRTSCLSNQKQIGLAAQQYAQDYDNGLPAWSEYYGMSAPGAESPYRGDSSSTGLWQSKLQPYIKSGSPEAANNTGVWQCPSLGSQGEPQTNASGGVHFSYGYSHHMFYFNPGAAANVGTSYYFYPSLVEMDEPTNTVLVGECGYPGRLASPTWFQTATRRSQNNPGAYWEVPDRHLGGANYVFADGHAKWLKREATYPNLPVATNRQAAWRSVVNFFAYNSTERNAYRRLLGEPTQ